MEINTIEPAFKTPDNIPIKNELNPDVAAVNIEPGKKRKCVEESGDLAEDESTEAAEALAISLQELCSVPVMVMGLFDIFFENVPTDVKVQYKNAGISISAYYLPKPDKHHVNLNKYITKKLK